MSGLLDDLDRSFLGKTKTDVSFLSMTLGGKWNAPFPLTKLTPLVPSRPMMK